MGTPGMGRSGQSQERIPVTLQNVFLASNRGNEVHKPPPGNIASRTFSRLRFFRKKKKSVDGSLHSISSHRKQKKGLKQNHHKEGGADVKLSTKDSQPSSLTVISPQAHLDNMLRSRGYCTRRFKTLQSAYHNKPTALQLASHHVHLVDMIREKKYYDIGMILSSGVSPNPCNEWGENLVHMVCRRGDHKVLKVFISNRCSMQIADDQGRTPLHDACWSAEPALETVKLILEQDARLVHMTDCRDSTPLAYVQEKHWQVWVDFLEGVKDTFWPVRDLKKDGKQGPPPLTLQEPNSRPLPDPENSLEKLDLVRMVVSGQIEAEEARFLKDNKLADKQCSVTDEDSFSDLDDSFQSDDHASVATFDESEMSDIIKNVSAHSTGPIRWSPCKSRSVSSGYSSEECSVDYSCDSFAASDGGELTEIVSSHSKRSSSHSKKKLVACAPIYTSPDKDTAFEGGESVATFCDDEMENVLMNISGHSDHPPVYWSPRKSQKPVASVDPDDDDDDGSVATFSEDEMEQVLMNVSGHSAPMHWSPRKAKRPIQAKTN